jgi:hypothetical protein
MIERLSRIERALARMPRNAGNAVIAGQLDEIARDIRIDLDAVAPRSAC